MNKLLPAFLIAATASAVPTSSVVFGNLGANGTDGLDATNTDITSTVKLGVAFNTGNSSSLYLTSITIGAFSSATDNYTLSIYTGSSTAPSATLVATSSLNIVNQDSGLFTFNFSGVTFDANTTYWVLPEQGLSWYANADFSTGIEQNGSGYIGIANRRSNDAGSTWSNYSVPYSISIQAVSAPVPEASTYGIALGGLAIAAAVVRRRKQAK